MKDRRLPESYHTSEQTIQAVNEAHLQAEEPKAARRRGRTALSSAVETYRVHPLILEYLAENAPLTDKDGIDWSYIQINREDDSVTILNNPVPGK